jgi:hypothetical protein
MINAFGLGSGNLLTVPINIVALVAMLANSYHSDRSHERVMHMIIPGFISSVFWLATAYFTATKDFVSAYVCLLVGASGTWLLLPLTISFGQDTIKLRKRSQSVGVALIVSIGAFGGLIGPQITALTYVRGTVHFSAVSRSMIFIIRYDGSTYAYSGVVMSGLMLCYCVLTCVVHYATTRCPPWRTPSPPTASINDETTTKQTVGDVDDGVPLIAETANGQN